METPLRLSSARPPRSVVWVAMLCGAPVRGEFHPFSSAVHLQNEGSSLQCLHVLSHGQEYHYLLQPCPALSNIPPLSIGIRSYEFWRRSPLFYQPNSSYSYRFSKPLANIPFTSATY